MEARGKNMGSEKISRYIKGMRSSGTDVGHQDKGMWTKFSKEGIDAQIRY